MACFAFARIDHESADQAVFSRRASIGLLAEAFSRVNRGAGHWPYPERGIGAAKVKGRLILWPLPRFKTSCFHRVDVYCANAQFVEKPYFLLPALAETGVEKTNCCWL